MVPPRRPLRLPPCPFYDAGHRSHLIYGCLGIGCDCHQDLHSHGDTRYLSEGVGQRARRCSQGKQVGNAVQHSSHEENQEVKAGHGQRRSDHAVDSSQEEEGEDVLHVVHMSSVGVEKKGDLVTHMFSISCNVVTQPLPGSDDIVCSFPHLI